MATATVYFKTLLNPTMVNRDGWDVARYEYRKVSEISFDDKFANGETNMIMLSLVWDYHQNTEHPWVKNPRISSFVGETRSMMTEDIIEWRGVLYQVDGVGFSSVQLSGGK